MRQKTKVSYKRQKDLFDPNRFQETINIIGIGNSGSHTAASLARIGLLYITVFDFDKVSQHNLASQCYRLKDIGKLKTKSLKEYIKECTGIEITTKSKFKDQTLYGIVIICVDSMKERKRICKVLKKNPPKIIIDARMGGNTIEIYTRSTIEEYEKTLVDEIQREPCSARYICYNSTMCASLITNQVKRILKGETFKPNIIFDISTLRFVD